MNYKNYIKRRLTYLIENRRAKEAKFDTSRISFFSDTKRKEVIVWMWLQKDKDKNQIVETVIDKFNLSEQDATKMFYEAFPDGLEPQEEEMIDSLESTLNRVVDFDPSNITDISNVLMGTLPEEYLQVYNTNPQIQNEIKIVVGTLLKNRRLL